MSNEPIYIIYDGDCPFCANYMAMLRLRRAAGAVTLLNLREDHPAVREVVGRGFDLDEGMAVKSGERIYHGADAVHQIALMTSPVGVFNRLSAWVFKRPRLTRALYPALRACRNLTLKLLGRPPASQDLAAFGGRGADDQPTRRSTPSQ
ncbi:MAG: DCC1-like thiol-disulfide oxidoreductase family protein [Pseudomonadota bacterium]